jgi:hypothetical protein
MLAARSSQLLLFSAHINQLNPVRSSTPTPATKSKSSEEDDDDTTMTTLIQKMF